jgi:hypothetical protein
MFLVGICFVLMPCFIKKLRHVWLFIGGLLLIYSSIFPPYHAPDEADHFLSYLLATNQQSRVKEAEFSAERAHFGEIVFNQDIPFDVDWIGTKGKGFTPNVNPPDALRRSPITAHYWNLIAKFAHPASVEVQLLIIRLINSSLLFLVVIFSIYWLKLSGFMLLFTLLPSLPFFQMHVSNYPLLLSSFLLLTSLMFSSRLKDRSHGRDFVVYGLALAVASYLVLSSGRLGFLMYFLCIPGFLIQSGGWVNKNNELESRKRASLLGSFFCGLMICFSFYHVPPSFFIQFLPNVLQLDLSGNQFVLLFSVSLVLVFLTLLLFSPIINRVTSIFSKKTLILDIFRYFVLLFFTSSLFFWVFGTRYQYENIEGVAAPSSLIYIIKSIRSFILSYGIAIPDRNIVQYTLVGFGWLDAIPHYLVTLLLYLPISILVFFTFLKLEAKKHGLFFVSTLMIGILSLIQFIAVSFASLTQMVNLHGRYLLPFFIFQYIWFFEGFLPKLEFKGKDLVWFFSLAVHFGLLVFVFTRYYGWP